MSSGATGYSTSLLGLGRSNGLKGHKREDIPDKSVVAMIELVLKSVTVIEHKLQVVEAKIDRLSSLQDDVKTERGSSDCSAYAIVTGSEANFDLLSPSAALQDVNNERGTSDCSAYDVVTGSHDVPSRNKKHDTCDSSNHRLLDDENVENINDRDSVGNEPEKCFNPNEHVVYTAQVLEYHESDYMTMDNTVHHSMRAPRESTAKSLRSKLHNATKHTGDTSDVTQDQAVNVEIPIIRVNAEQIVDMQAPHSSTHTADNVTTNYQPVTRVSSNVDDKEQDLGAPLKGGITDPGTDNRADVPSGTFTNQFVDNDLTDGSEEHTVSNNSKPSRANNQTMNMSGFKNDHGNTDNRFLKEAHENLPLTSLRTGNLSNTLWIKSETWKTDVPNLKHQLRELLEQETRASRGSGCMRSAGIDTVICLDTSASMAGGPLQKATAVISQLVDGYEQNAIEHDLEENVAVVVFGKQNKILTHLTNDYNVVRDELFEVTAGGPSPLWLGLALALTEIKERGNMVTVGESVILPRIILITDGKASPKYILHGDETQNTDTAEETKQDIVTLLETCKKFSRTIDCIQVGPCEQDMLQLLSGGRMFTPDDVNYLTQFFRVQDMAAELTKKFASGGMITSSVDDIIKQFGFTKKAQDDLKELIQCDQDERNEDDQRTENMTTEKDVRSNNDEFARRGQTSGGRDESLRPGLTSAENDQSVKQGPASTRSVQSNQVRSMSINGVCDGSIRAGQTSTGNAQSFTSGQTSEGSHPSITPGTSSTGRDQSVRPETTGGGLDELRSGDKSVILGPASGSDSTPTPTGGTGDVVVPRDVEEAEETEECNDDIIDDVRDPLFGTSVEACETWIGYASRQNLTGTVMGPRKRGMVKVLWSDGTIDRCRYGVNGQYDFKIVPDMCFVLNVMQIGALIERGPDWRWKNQDGGPGSIGVVTKHDDRVVFVTWSHGGHGNYRFGYNKKYDIKLCESRPQQQAVHAVWQIKDTEGTWHDFDPAATKSIEQMFTYNPDSQFLVQLKTLSLRISIGTLEALDTKSRVTYTIRRLERVNEHSTTRESL